MEPSFMEMSYHQSWLICSKGQHKGDLREYSEETKPLIFYFSLYFLFLRLSLKMGLYQNGQVIDQDHLDFPFEVTYKSQHHSDLPFLVGSHWLCGFTMISL